MGGWDFFRTAVDFLVDINGISMNGNAVGMDGNGLSANGNEIHIDGNGLPTNGNETPITVME